MTQEQSGFLARPIPYVRSAKVNRGAVHSEKMLDRMAMLVGSLNLMTDAVQTMYPNRHCPHLRA